MKHKLITLFVLLALLLALAPVQPARAGGGTMFVDTDSNCVSSCGGSWATAYPTLQTALEGAGIGAVYWVAEGVYYPDEGSGQVNNSRTSTYELMNGVQIYGGFNGTETLLSQRDISANSTILSGDVDRNDVNTDGDFVAGTVADIVGNNAYHVVTGSGTDNTAILDGFIITAGMADGTSPHDQGGGVYNSGGSPTLSSVFFIGNRANIGGGMRNASGNPELTGNIFMNNSADFGGAMANWNSSPSITGATFYKNEATNSGSNTGFGGGMHNWNSSPSILETGFGSNDAVSGGGMYNAGASAPIITSGYFTGNDANYGGAMYNDGSNPIITAVDMEFNTALDQGGGIYNLASNPVYNSGSISENTANVDGGGIYNYSSNPEIKNATISENTATNKGGGMYNGYSNPVLTNVTMSENEASDGGGLRNYSSEILLKNTLIANSVSGGDCVNGDGVLIHAASVNNLIEDADNACGLTNGTNGNIVGVDPNLGELWNNGGSTQTHALLAASPAIDAGDVASCPTTDQRGIARPQGPKCDIGSYELEQTRLTFRSVGTNDGYILESTETSGVGGAMNNASTVFYLGDGAADKQYRAILHFDLTLPADAVITSATLKLKKQGLVGSDPFLTLGKIIVDIRTGAFSNKNILELTDFKAAAHKNTAAMIYNTPVNNWYSVAFPSSAFSFINKTGVTQFRLRFQLGDNDNGTADYLKFLSGDYATAAARPTLVIEYYVP
jgi:hypothetical protein